LKSATNPPSVRFYLTADKFRPAAYTVIDKAAVSNSNKNDHPYSDQQGNKPVTTTVTSPQYGHDGNRQPVQSSGFTGNNQGLRAPVQNNPGYSQGLGQSNMNNQSGLGASTLLKQSVVGYS
jgi:hypothetical protein